LPHSAHLLLSQAAFPASSSSTETEGGGESDAQNVSYAYVVGPCMARLIEGSPHDAISIFSNALLFDIMVDYLGGDYRNQLLRPDFWELFAAPEDFDRELDWDWRPTPVLSLLLVSFPKHSSVAFSPSLTHELHTHTHTPFQLDTQIRFGCPDNS
jgi:hypothetical protein